MEEGWYQIFDDGTVFLLNNFSGENPPIKLQFHLRMLDVFPLDTFMVWCLKVFSVAWMVMMIIYRCIIVTYLCFVFCWVLQVAGIVRNRSAEMVEALYTMNRVSMALIVRTAPVVYLSFCQNFQTRIWFASTDTARHYYQNSFTS